MFKSYFALRRNFYFLDSGYIAMEASCSGKHTCTMASNGFGPSQISTRLRYCLSLAFKCTNSTLLSRGGRAELFNSKRLQNTAEGRRWHRSHRQMCRSSSVASPSVQLIGQGEVADVEEIEGIRVVMDEQKRPLVQYLIKWKVRMVVMRVLILSCLMCIYEGQLALVDFTSQTNSNDLPAYSSFV